MKYIKIKIFTLIFDICLANQNHIECCCCKNEKCGKKGFSQEHIKQINKNMKKENDKLNNLKEENQRLKDGIEQIKNEQTGKDLEFNNLVYDYYNIERENKNLENEVNNLKRKINGIYCEKQKNDEEYNHLVDDYYKLNDENDKLIEENKKLKDEIVKLKKELEK